MRLTIFSRIMLAQSALIVLLVAVSFFAMERLNALTALDTSILMVDSDCIDQEKLLLKTFLSEMRNAEKYLLLRDAAFHSALDQGKSDFAEIAAKIGALTDTQDEQDIVRTIASLHNRYHQEVELAASGGSSTEQTRKEISDGLIDRTNDLIRLREKIIAGKTATARDQAASAAETMAWMTMAGVILALILAYFHARGVSRPLKKLAHVMRRVGRGEFSQSLSIPSPSEVHELAKTFNWMTEKLAQLDKLKADFTAHVSHELRTPLTAIREGTALMLEEIPGPLTRQQREILEVVSNHSERLFTGISSILDLSKMEAEMMEYEFTACDLPDLIRRSITSVELIARSKGIHLDTVLDNSLPIVQVDERRIRQVLDNLLSNALKFTPEGGRISINASLQGERENQHLEIRISDTGDGIPENEIEEVFKRFYQSSRNRGKQRQGTGLGLAIARHIVEAHHGAIRAESKLGEGSTFIVTLPVLRAAGMSASSDHVGEPKARVA